jgi:hypothetical protein
MSETATINTRLIQTLTQIILTLTDEERDILFHQISEAAVSDQEALKAAIAVGATQLQNGQYTEYDEASLPDLLLKIKERGRQRLEQEQS